MHIIHNYIYLSSKGNQPWVFTGRNDAEAPIFWPPDAKSQLIGKIRPWCWERLKAKGEGDDREWDGWMASLTQWTWVWANSGRWWRTGKPDVLQSTGLQRATEQQALRLKPHSLLLHPSALGHHRASTGLLLLYRQCGRGSWESQRLSEGFRVESQALWRSRKPWGWSCSCRRGVVPLPPRQMHLFLFVSSLNF